jgi:hypothetical protein
LRDSVRRYSTSIKPSPFDLSNDTPPSMLPRIYVNGPATGQRLGQARLTGESLCCHKPSFRRELLYSPSWTLLSSRSSRPSLDRRSIHTCHSPVLRIQRSYLSHVRVLSRLGRRVPSCSDIIPISILLPSLYSTLQATTVTQISTEGSSDRI